MSKSRTRSHTKSSAKPGAGQGGKPSAKQGGKLGAKQGGKPSKQAAPRTPAGRKRSHAPVGRPDGPLARRRRVRIRLLVLALLVVNIAAALVWRAWSVSLAVLIVSVITAPLLAALLLRRRR